MTENASPFFIRPYRFDDPDQDDTHFPRLDWHRRLVLDGDERVLWRDQVDVAGYLLTPGSGTDELAWALPRRAEVTVTDRRLSYVCADCHIGPAPGLRADPRHRRRGGPARTGVVTGQIRWQWPAGLRILSPSISDTGPGVAAERLLIVCDAVRAIGRPALALSGGPLGSPQSLRRLATAVRRAVAGFRLANPTMVELAPPEWDALLSRAGLALFADARSGPRCDVDLPGALPVEFAHRDDYYRRSLRRRNAPAPSRSSAPPTGNTPTTSGGGSPTPGRNLSPSSRNTPTASRVSAGPTARWSARQPGSAS